MLIALTVIALCMVLTFLWTWMFLLEKQIFRKINFHQLRKPELYAAHSVSSVPLAQQALVKIGLAKARSSRIVICGLACNLADSLPMAQSMIACISPLFRDYRIVIFENNSKDQTRVLLQQWAQRDPKVLLLMGDADHNQNSLYAFGSLSRNRMQRMAAYRNRYLDWIKQNASDWELALVLDLDLKGQTAVDGLLHSLAFEWDAVAANGHTSVPGTLGTMTYMYDGMVLPAEDRSVTDDAWAILGNRIKTNLQLLGRTDLLPVRSAFNGATLYKVSSLIKATYSGERCEHTCLHDSMRAQGVGAIYINPLWRLYGQIQGPTVTRGLKSILS